MDMKKEIKLSDLFKRKPKDTADETVAVEEKPKGSGLKREISFRRRKGGDDAEPKEKAPKEPKRKRSRGAAKAAPAVPQVPLMRAFNLLPKDAAGEAEGRRPSTPQLGMRWRASCSSRCSGRCSCSRAPAWPTSSRRSTA